LSKLGTATATAMANSIMYSRNGCELDIGPGLSAKKDLNVIRVSEDEGNAKPNGIS
jgi:hypothetical protein